MADKENMNVKNEMKANELSPEEMNKAAGGGAGLVSDLGFLEHIGKGLVNFFTGLFGTRKADNTKQSGKK